METIERIVTDFLKPRPRIICICGDFVPVKRDDFMAWTKCACGGWQSDIMRAELTVRDVTE